MTSPEPVRRLLPLVVGGVAAAALLLSGCSNGVQTTAAGAEPTAAAPATASSATPSAPSEASAGPEPSTAPSARPRPTSSISTTTARTPGRCTAAGLAVGVRSSAGGAAAGSNYVLLTYRNTSSASCVLTGFPGVSFVGHGNGTQLGDPAVRNRTNRANPVRVAPGATTTSLLQIANAGNYDAKECAPTTADGFRVYPPGSRAAVYVAFGVAACQRSTASNPQLTVSPVGTSG